MKNDPIVKTVYVDFLGQSFDTKQDAERSNNDLHLTFRKYIEEELIVTFSDGKVDKLKTTNQLWKSLDFTPECIKSIISIMER